LTRIEQANGFDADVVDFQLERSGVAAGGVVVTEEAATSDRAGVDGKPDSVGQVELRSYVRWAEVATVFRESQAKAEADVSNRYCNRPEVDRPEKANAKRHLLVIYLN
jgi:hypothetical protein